MDPSTWDRIQRLFHDAPEIESQVLALLVEDRSDDSLLDQGLANVADAVLDGSESAPRQIGPYRVLRLLGEGGMGVVYLAQREDLDSLAAIKLLRDAKLAPHRRERFLQEERFLASLSHPSIARLYDAGTLADGTPYFVMEYVDGIPLTEFCEQHGLSLAQRLNLFRQVCEAVQYAHRQALIHRDLKPSNILVRREAGSDTGAVKLLDFGIAKHANPVEGQPSLTRTALGIMTPAYAAPEQLRGESIGVWTDVYSLGVVLYELLTGGLPYDVAERPPASGGRPNRRRPSRPRSAGGSGRTSTFCV